MTGHRHLFAALGLTALVFASCSAPFSTAKPTTTDGEELFELKAMGGQAGCVTCHSLVADRVLVGPSLAGIADRAAGRVEGLDAREYVRQSIVDPDALVIAGFDSGKMPQVFGTVLSDVQLDALIDFLLEQA